MTHSNSKVIPTTNNNYSYHICKSCRTCLTNHMKSIPYHIMPLVINSFRGRYTHTHARTHAHTHTHTHTHKHTHTHTHTHVSISRNQACASCTPGLKIPLDFNPQAFGYWPGATLGEEFHLRRENVIASTSFEIYSYSGCT